MASHRPKVVVAMSGGVDSSVAAALLLRQGYEVVGCFMRLGLPEGVGELAEACEVPGEKAQRAPRQACCSVRDADDARKVAAVLGIPLYSLNFQDDFGRVIDYFVAEYNRGRTPNPCIRCNQWLKFGKLAKYAEAMGAQFIASGHYARVGVDEATGQWALSRAADHRKDQSYVLFGLTPEMLAHTLLPIGDYEKEKVRDIAREMNLPVYSKPDSQEICFVPNQDYAGLVERRSPKSFRQGEVVATDGRVLGQHQGHQHFTIGQRRGVGVAAGHPLYVIDIDAQANRVTLGQRDELLKCTLVARQVNWISDRVEQAGGTLRCEAKIRYNHQPQPATVCAGGEDEFTVRFDQPQSAITPGQAVVIYEGERILGGGWIESAS